MFNKIILIGRLTRDPELRYTPSGVAVANFSLAVDRQFSNQQGERETDFIDIVVWRKLAETCSGHLNKGRLVAVEGRLQIRSYETQDGQRRKAAEVVAENVRFLDSPKSNGNSNGAGAGSDEGAGSYGEAPPAGEDEADEVPF